MSNDFRNAKSEQLRRMLEEMSDNLDRTEKPKETEYDADSRRLEELQRMKKAQGMTPGLTKLGDVDEERYLKLCEAFENMPMGKDDNGNVRTGFTCSAPPGWKEEYERYMENRQRHLGGGGSVKPVGKRRWT
tara:strand:+ start:377948 stop:378343 length:396 start_codon:yes stop_codon:yes gene_type:complete